MMLCFGAATAVAAEVRIGAHGFTLPDGFEIELVAAAPLVERPISAAFDEEGRLYVTDSSGSNDKVEKQLAEKPHRVVRLEDTDGDGRFDRSIVFADKMMLPQGAMWLNGSVYVAAPPSIWKLTDTDGDGVADQREEWFKGKTLTGCANDLHGPYAGPDGWIYWCKGAFAEQTHEQPGRAPIKDRAAHIFRCRRDGTGLESVMSGGMDNPVEVAFTRTGEPIFTATFIDLSGGGKRDGLGHAIYGGVFGKQHDVVDGVRRTGELLPAMTHFGPGAPSGLCRYESAVFGAEYRDNLFATLFNLHKVTRHVLIPNGATFRTEDSDFVVSDNLDFHPTDVLEDADGSLLIVDTGGWYKLCCPTSQLAKPDVLGAIYRVRKKGAPPVSDPRGEKIAWSELDSAALVNRLGDARPAVVARACERLVANGASSMKALEERLVSAASPIEQRQRAMWTIGRLKPGDLSVGARCAEALLQGEPAVQQIAAKIARVLRMSEVSPILTYALERSTAPHARRTIAEALGCARDAGAVRRLLASADDSGTGDRFFEHAVIHALLEINDAAATRAAMQHASSDAARRVALIALNEMENGGLASEEVVPMHGSDSPVLRETARWIVERHGDWGGAVAEFLRGRFLDDAALSHALLVRSAGDAAVQQLVAEKALNGTAAERALAVRVIAAGDVKTLPPSWVAVLQRVVAERPPGLVEEALKAALRKDAAPQLVESVAALAGDPAVPASTRFAALGALPAGKIPRDPAVFALLVEGLAASDPTTRSAAAAMLARAPLDDTQRAALIELLPRLAPLELARLIPAFASAEALHERLLAALGKAPALPSMPAAVLGDLFAKLAPKLQPEAERLLARLDTDLAQQRARLNAIAAELSAGDVHRGHAVFQSAKAACSTCHAVGYLGGKLGPDLSAIGPARSERDLLEAIVFPSASFVRSYEPVAVRTSAGEELLGIVRGENDESITLATGPANEQRVARAEIAEMRPGATSLMPPGYDQILTRQELADLIAFLKGAAPK